MSAIIELAASGLILTGALIVAIAGLGIVRLPDPFARMHAATKAGVLGAGMIMLGVGLSLGTFWTITTGLLGVAFLLTTSPLASHALGRAAYMSGAPIAAANMTDALSGVLPRNIFDISPGRVTRKRGDFNSVFREPSTTVGSSMSAIDIRTYSAQAPSAEDLPLRSITTWLIGGPHQTQASQFAFALANRAGAKLTGLSALDASAADHRGPVPIGGMAWARWLGDQRRQRMRERSGKALAEFEALASSSSLSVNVRHEEQTFDDIVTVAAGADLLIVPAAIDRIGEPAQYGDELAAQLSAARLAPVLRVRNDRAKVDRVLLIVSNSNQCGRLAPALIRTGLWRNALIRVVTVAEQSRPHVARLADEQASLLIEHGYDVKRLPTIDLDEDQNALQGRIDTVDAVLTGVLSNRRGWFGAVREDIHEIAALRAPLILLP